MDKKEAAYLLQRIDCNCNDCGFMWRNIQALDESRLKHFNMQHDYFDRLRERMKEKYEYWMNQGDQQKGQVIMAQTESMKFQYQSPATGIHYGHCQKFDKPVTFIPNTCQLETQKCFVHRKDYNHEITSSVSDKDS